MSDYMFHFKHWRDQMMKNRELHTLPFGHKQSLDLSLPFFPTAVNYYRNLLVDPNIYPIPYDFRQIDDHAYLQLFFSEVRTYIESFERPVIFLCHSSGGLVAHSFLHFQTEAWRRRWIRFVVHVNVPFGGVAAVLEHCVREDTPINRYIGTPMFQSLGGAVWNMPNVEVLGHSVLTVDGAAVDDYFGYFGLASVQRRYRANQHIIDSFRYATGLETHVAFSTSPRPNSTLVGLDVHTLPMSRFKRRGSYADVDNETVNPFSVPPYTSIQSTMGNGDSVVSLSSLLVPRQWNDTNVFFHHLRNSEHSDVF